MHTILNPPMATRCFCQLFCRLNPMENVIACFLLIVALYPSLTGYFAEMRQPSPRITARDVRQVVRNCMCPPLIPTVVSTFSRIGAKPVTIACIVLLVKRLDHCHLQFLLISFHRNGISRLFCDDVVGNLLLASHCIN